MFYTVFLGSILIFNVLLALLVLVKNPKNHINISFSMFVVSIVIWMATNYLSNQPTDYNTALLLNKLIFLFTPYIAYALLYFSLVFPGNIVRFPINLNKLLILLIPVIISNICTITNNTISSITFLKEGGTGVIFSSLIIIYAIQFLAYLLVAVVLLIIKYFKSTGYQKTQLQYLLFGIMILVVTGSITNLIIPLLFNNFNAMDFGPLTSIAVVGFTSYAILKHRLLDIRFVVARTVAYTLLLMILSVVYVGSIFGVSNLFLNNQTFNNTIIIYAILALFISITSHPLKEFLEKVTDKIFFKNNYNSNELLSRLTKILAMNLRLEDITTKTLNELLETIYISRGTFFIFHGKEIMQSASGGFGGPKMSNKKIILELCEKKRILIFEEEKSEKNKEIMRKLDISIALPLYVENKINGILLLGEKKSGDIYFDKDIEVLKIFGSEVSVAVENAKAYEEIRRFNVTLREEIARATKDLQKANVKLKEIDKLKDEFVSLASHELRTPMTVIKSYLWLMLDKNNIGALSEKQKKYIDRAYTSTQRLINLVNDMLNVSRIESGRLTLNMSPIDLVDLISTVHTEMLPKAQEQKIDLEFTKPIQLLPKVQADPERVEQVLINLIGNSLKFTPEKGTIKISIIYNSKEKQETISIEDTGKGIGAEDISKLFQKFSMVGTNYLIKQNAQGTGLGLYLSKSIVELMGGKIWAESAGLGKGSKFNFTLKTV